ncbi:hypothetical protein COCMIDRAFT_101888 [Bipolaris oryzae ATCC 44560]|uniref:Uncharacterized protein n=1 Tax=Bipolaris oryzae ATCC 44560 TaxID=930090 RepID=W6YZN3_COCMI|nr:uncharacterized protein COCMIDRAFT_101888 [Bipolaris oryzae ATCC 44560]EUC43043.1 hypothetical protein COCMIDRAFT_101888 [Bipolaris oryzae ATCC 44560]
MADIKLTRKARYETAEAQILDLSFTIEGAAFEHPDVFDNSKPVFINARKASSIMYKKAIAKWEENPNGPKSRETLELTAAETAQEIEEDMERYLLVGWVPQTQQQPGKVVRRYGRPVGIDRPEEDKIITFDKDEDDLPLMVVVKSLDEEVKLASVFKYVLLEQVDGLCTPYSINSKEVYHLSLYRDMTTMNHKRLAAWNQLACKYAYQGHKKPEVWNTKRSQATRDREMAVPPPNKDSGNDVDATSTEDMLEDNASYSSEMADVPSDISEDLSCDSDKIRELQAFVDAANKENAPFTQAQADVMVEEAQVLWSNAQHLDSYHVYLLAQGMREVGLAPAYPHLKAFVLEGCYHIAKMSGEVTIEELGAIALQAEETVKRVLSYIE